MPIIIGILVNALIKLSAVDHDEALGGREKVTARSVPFAPIIKNKTPKKKNITGTLNTLNSFSTIQLLFFPAAIPDQLVIFISGQAYYLL
ncbi:hypothetical protein [Mesobacillus thioparans]|uniref:hypothetical protein n=1 Tax=Mesobacillus thioparans TaxID=370439 RepID=UPI0039EE2EE2